MHQKHVILANGQKISVKVVGIVSITPHFHLFDVLYIPYFHVNLISVSSLLQHSSYSLSFYQYSYVIQDKSQMQMIGKASLSHGLYVLHVPYKLCVDSSHNSVSSDSVFSDITYNKVDVPSNTLSINTCKSMNKKDAYLWHARFGHLSNHVLKILSNKIDISLPASFNSHTCHICPISKFF